MVRDHSQGTSTPPWSAAPPVVALPDAAAAAALKLKAVARARAADEAAAAAEGKGADGGHSESKKVAPSVETLAELVASLHAVSAGAGGAGGGGGLLDAVAEAKASSGL